MKLRISLSLLIAAFALLTITCSDSTVAPPDVAQITVSSSIGSLALGGNVTRVVLEVSGSDFETFTEELELVDGQATATIEVPFGANRRFKMSAYDEGTLLYQGESVASVVAGAPTIVTIILLPQVSMLRVAPAYDQVLLGELDSMSIMIHDVDSLFGIAFRIVYDTTLLEINSVWPGGFLDPEATLLFTRKESDYLAISHSLLGSQSPMGVSGSGPIVKIVYTAKGVGRCPIQLTNSGSAWMVDWRGEQLIDQENFYIEHGEVEVIAP